VTEHWSAASIPVISMVHRACLVLFSWSARRKFRPLLNTRDSSSFFLTEPVGQTSLERVSDSLQRRRWNAILLFFGSFSNGPKPRGPTPVLLVHLWDDLHDRLLDCLASQATAPGNPPNSRVENPPRLPSNCRRSSRAFQETPGVPSPYYARSYRWLNPTCRQRASVSSVGASG
jgi:hypothetical protein